MARPQPGDIWHVDLGMVAKARPCLVLSEFPREDELALILIIPHTTSIGGNQWEFVCEKPFLKAGAFHLQQLQPVSCPKFQRKLGELTSQEFAAVRSKLPFLLNLVQY